MEIKVPIPSIKSALKKINKMNNIQTSKFYTYLYCDTDGTPRYIGKGNGGRAWHHFKAKTRLGYMLRKRKAQGITIEPELQYHTSEDLAFAEEIKLISKYGRDDLGTGTLFNNTNGGDGWSGPQPWTSKNLTERHKNSSDTPTKIQVGCLECKKIFNILTFGHHVKSCKKQEDHRKLREQKNLKPRQWNNPNPRRGIPLSEESKQNMRKPKSENGKLNMRKPKAKVKCPHCNMIGGTGIMKRWHFNNCKSQYVVPGSSAAQMTLSSSVFQYRTSSTMKPKVHLPGSIMM